MRINDTLTYVAGLGAGFTGLTSLPAVAQPASQGNVIVAVIGLITMLLQAFIMNRNKKSEVSKTQINNELTDLQQQFSVIKTKGVEAANDEISNVKSELLHLKSKLHGTNFDGEHKQSDN